MNPSSKTERDPIEEIAVGTWTRLRNLMGALDRVDRLETSEEFPGWLQSLAQDDSALQATIREFLLRAVRMAGDPVNARILTDIMNTGEQNVHSLLRATGLPRVELVERLTELARAGLTVQTLDGDRVETTSLARGLYSLLDEIGARVKTQAQDDYLMNPRASAPQPPAVHARKVHPKS